MDHNQSDQECCFPGASSGDKVSKPRLATAPPAGSADDAAFDHFVEHLVGTAQTLNPAGLNLAQAASQGGVVLQGARFLSYRMGPCDNRQFGHATSAKRG